jgi:hypothetical protein
MTVFWTRRDDCDFKPEAVIQDEPHAVSLAIAWHPRKHARNVENRVTAATYRLLATLIEHKGEARWPVYADLNGLGAERTKLRAEVDTDDERKAAKALFEGVAELLRGEA